MNHTLSDSQLEAMIKSAVNSSGPLPPDEKFSQLISALRELQERRKADSEPYGFTDGDRRGMIYEPQYADRLKEPLPVYRHAQSAPVVPEVDADDNFYSWFGREWAENYQHNQYTTAAKQMLGVMAESAWKAGRRAAMLAAAPQEITNGK